MADIINRSRFCVSVNNRADLTRHFPHNQLAHVEAYMAELRALHLKPRVKQLDESFLARIRQTGYKPINKTFPTEAEAVAFVNKVLEERHRGLFIDYTKSHKVTFAELLVRYLRDEAPRHKSRQILAYKIEGWLEDSGNRGAQLLEAFRAERRARGLPVRAAEFKMRAISNDLDWIHKRLPEVTTMDIEDFINERLNIVMPGTVDREIDIFKAIFKVATTVWDYNLAKNPMDAVRRPKYFNERDRRLTKHEERKLLQALAELDIKRSMEPVLADMADAALAGTPFSSTSARKKVLAQVRSELREQAENAVQVVPYLQTFYFFQVMTGARRGETLELTWNQIDFEAGTAFLPETKNGRSRKLSLRCDLLELLRELPRDGNRVFAVGVDYLVGAWAKACETAGIEDLRIHDLRHEAISRVAETGQFTLPELQQFSGHRDMRMLMRYAHLCASRLAKKLDDCFKEESAIRVHKGRKFLNKSAPITPTTVVHCAPGTDHLEAPAMVGIGTVLTTDSSDHPNSAIDLPTNVIRFRRR